MKYILYKFNPRRISETIEFNASPFHKRFRSFVITGLWGILSLSFGSCNKEKFLATKPNTQLVVPSSLSDFQNLLDNYTLQNAGCVLPIASADEYYMFTNASYNSMVTMIRNAYIWKPDIFEGNVGIVDWNTPYAQILNANIVLEGLNSGVFTNNSNAQYRLVKGWAYFSRAHALFNLLQVFALPYDETTAGQDLGVPIKLDADVTVANSRSSLKACYEQVIADLKISIDLLPSNVQVLNINRPGKPAAYALLARTYLNMRKYEDALASSKIGLDLYSTLMDFNTNPTFNRNNPEVLFQSEVLSNSTTFSALVSPNTVIDSSLIKLYKSNDLRMTKFLRASAGKILITIGYSGTISPFVGLANDEVYLINAECLVRKGLLDSGINVLNKLMINRIQAATFVPYHANSSAEALSIVLDERRKELVFRGSRWQDVRRLNKEGSNIILKRTINGLDYSIAPNSPLYALPIPGDEIRLSGIKQNVR